MSNRPKQPRRVEGRRFGNASIPFHRRGAVGPVARASGGSKRRRAHDGSGGTSCFHTHGLQLSQ